MTLKAVLWATLALLPAAHAAPTVTIDAGAIVGTTTSLPGATATVNKFLGVPFAKSPPERFSPPVKPVPWKKPIQATKWSPACIQQFVYPKEAQEFVEEVFNNPPPAESEDCLYLNVYAPSTPAPSDGRAVMYWIYGGSLQFGNAGQQAYDGSWFAAYEDVIVVSVNYRTNVFGFPSSPELPLGGHNLGFLDQRLGLEWVQSNIAAFGGSPKKVTVFGESAGAISIDALLTSYPSSSTPPFRGAILESGQISYGVISETFTADSTPQWTNLSKALGCPGKYKSDLACVRAAPVNKIKQIIDQEILEFEPTQDNITLVSDPAARRAAGNIARVPVLTGTNAQEGRVFTVGTTNTTEYLEANLGAAATPELISALLTAYPLGKDGLNTPYDQISQIYTELFLQCPQALFANATAKANITSWRYYFNASFENTQAYPNLGVYHSSEIPIVFSTYPPVNITTQEYALSIAMRGAWARFAKDPAGGPGWNPVGTGMAGPVLLGANGVQIGGVAYDSSGKVVHGTWDLAVLGNVDEVMGSGVTVIDQYEVDFRCADFAALVSGVV